MGGRKRKKRKRTRALHRLWKKKKRNVTILESAERSSLLQREKQKLARQLSGEIKTFILSSRLNERDTFGDGIQSWPRALTVIKGLLILANASLLSSWMEEAGEPG